mgnify:FL=1
MSLSIEAVTAAVSGLLEPETGKTLGALGAVRDVALAGDVASMRIVLGSPAYQPKELLAAHVEAAAKKAGASKVEVRWDYEMTRRAVQADDPCPEVANIVLVMSGKGGVGKSTVATNLSLALARAGAKVGLLDADMYGPSIPTMLGVNGRPVSADGQKFLPLERFGMKLMSLGFMLEDSKQAVVWRGPMLQGALLQFLKDVDWGKLDYLVLDLPPGTGDIALTISQKLRCTGAIIVTTPQEVALQDVYKSVSMAQKVGIPILGVVENESWFVCGECNARHELFGKGGGQLVAEQAEAPLLGQIPLDPSVRAWGDAGTPIVESAPDSIAGKALTEVAYKLAGRITAHNLSRENTAPLIDRSGGKNRHLPVAR